MASQLFQEVLSEVKPETTTFIKEYLDTIERIHALKEKREKIRQSSSLVQKPPKESDH